MEDSGVHLDDSPINFTGDPKVTTTYPCAIRHVAAAASTLAEVTIVQNSQDEQEESEIVVHGVSSRDILATTMQTLTIRGQNDSNADSDAPQSKLLPLSLNPLRLKQSLSACDGVNFYSGSDIDLDHDDLVKVEPSHLTEDVFLSAPETPVARSSVGKPGGMTKFQKFFEPLRRSRSTGNAKDSKQEQTFSLFFRSVSRKEERLSADTGNGSMESELDHDSDDPSRVDRNKWKNLSSEMKEKFSILLRHHGDLPGHFRDTRRQKMTLEAVNSWAMSFDDLLADKNGLHWFREFLKSEFSEENIEFWIACEEYKHLKAHKMPTQAQKIFMQFVTYQAPREINIDSRTRDLTYENMKHPEVTAFEAAQKRIESLMGKDSYPRFIESDLYLHLLSGFKS